MDPRLDERQAGLRDTAREAAAGLAASGNLADPAATLKSLAEADLVGASLPEAHGGRGDGLLGLVLVVEEIARVGASVAAVLVAHEALAAGAIDRHGSDDQKARLLPDLISGRVLACFASDGGATLLDEPAPGVKARETDGGLLVTGELPPVTGAAVADLLVTPASGPGDEITLVVVRTDADGIARGEPAERMGLEDAGAVALSFDDVPVGTPEVLARGRREDLLTPILDNGRLAHAALSLGIAQSALDRCLEKVEGSSERLAASQTVQWMLADSATETEAARLLLWYATDRERPDERTEAAAMARLLASEAAVAATRRALHLHGSAGGDRALGVERLHRDAQMMELHAGTNEAQRRTVAARILPDLAG